MTWYFDKKTLGFPSSLVSGERGKKGCMLPPSAQLVELTDDEYASLSEGISSGMVVVLGSNGRPTLASRQVSPPPTAESINESRLRAYADPVNGSDRLFAEASRMQVMGEAGHESVLAKAVARYAEIQSKYPWPNK